MKNMMKMGTIAVLLLTFARLEAQPRLAGEPVRITPEGGIYQQPVWSPDDRWIAVTGMRYDGIYIVRPDGKDFQQITADAAVGFKMSWSPDGIYLLGRAARWQKRRRYNSAKIYDIYTKTSRQLSDERTFMPAIPVWGGSNARVVLSSDRGFETFEVPIPKGQRLQAVARPIVLVANDAIEVRSADGRLEQQFKPADGRILYAASSPKDELLVFEIMGGQLFVAALDGSHRIALGRGERPQWSPDGEWILFMVTEDDGHRMLGSELYAVRKDGKQRLQLTRTANRMEMNPVWSPDGGAIAFDEEKSGGVFVAKIVWSE